MSLMAHHSGPPRYISGQTHTRPVVPFVASQQDTHIAHVIVKHRGCSATENNTEEVADLAAESFCSHAAAFVAKRLQRGTVALAASWPCCMLVLMPFHLRWAEELSRARGRYAAFALVQQTRLWGSNTLGTWCRLPCVSAPLSSCGYRNVTVMSFSACRPSEPAEPAAAQAASGTLPSEAHADGRRHPGRLRLGLHRLNRAACARRGRKREACWSQVRRETGPPATCHPRGKTRRQSKRNLIFFFFLIVLASFSFPIHVDGKSKDNHFRRTNTRLTGDRTKPRCEYTLLKA